jgi:hypothetical protein
MINRLPSTTSRYEWYVLDWVKTDSYLIFHIKDSTYEIYYSSNKDSGKYFLEAYGSFQRFLQEEDTSYIVFKDSIVNQPSLVIEKKWTFDNSIQDSIIIKLSKPVIFLPFLYFTFYNSNDTTYWSFLRWGINKPLQLKLKKGEFDEFYCSFNGINVKEKYYSKKHSLNGDSNNVLHLNIGSNYRSYNHMSSTNLTGDTAFYIGKNKLLLTNRFNVYSYTKLSGVSSRFIKKHYPLLYKLKYPNVK